MSPKHKNVGAEKHLKLFFAGHSSKQRTLRAVVDWKSSLRFVAPSFSTQSAKTGHSLQKKTRNPRPVAQAGLNFRGVTKLGPGPPDLVAH